MKVLGHSLEEAINAVDTLKLVQKNDLACGDFVLVETRNSLYKIQKLENNLYEVSGGWFDREGLSPMVLTIRGCSWGANIIKIDVVATCGLCLEFGNNLVTSPIVKIIVVPSHQMN